MELDLALQYRWKSDFCKVLHAQIPLHAQAGLDGNVGIALAVAYLVLIVLDMVHKTGFLQVNGNLSAYIRAVHADIHACSLADSTVGVEDVYGLQVVCLAQVVVVDIMCGSNLQTAGTELDVHIAVLDYGNDAPNQRYYDLVALEPLVLGVFGVDAHCGIAHDGFGTCRCDYGIVAAFILVDDVACIFRNFQIFRISHVVLQVVQLALLLAVDYLDV